MSDFETEADLVGDLGADPTASYSPPEPALPPVSAANWTPPPPPWGDDPESWTPDMLIGITSPPVPPGQDPEPWGTRALRAAQQAKRAEREESARLAAESAARIAREESARQAQADAAAAAEERASLLVPYSPKPPPSGADDRSATVNRSFRLPLDSDRALRNLAAYDRMTDSAELSYCILFRERLLARAHAGKTWCLVDDDAIALLPPGKAYAVRFELSYTPGPL